MGYIAYAATDGTFAILPGMLLVSHYATRAAFATFPIVDVGSCSRTFAAALAIARPVMRCLPHGSANGTALAIARPVMRRLPHDPASGTALAILRPVVQSISGLSADHALAISRPVVRNVAGLTAVAALAMTPFMQTD